MANHASAKKANRQNLRRNAINKSRLSRIKTYVKKVLHALTTGSKESAQQAFINAQSEIMKGVSKDVLKLNTASRKISSLAKKVKKLSTTKSS